ncbi:hypothetical protein Anapl_07692 [Anas platyrhynchos]|uniref:Uncharacterized protein n=1 Tax=Anas platyrhynchos TaxID=8839 RepID=R0JYD8_ANAPL|nr:hypothetical protein Anapl_07692 [Anas platyrhynchos]
MAPEAAADTSTLLLLGSARGPEHPMMGIPPVVGYADGCRDLIECQKAADCEQQQQRSAQFPLTLMGISKRCAEGKEREKKEFAASHFSNAATRAIAIC